MQGGMERKRKGGRDARRGDVGKEVAEEGCRRVAVRLGGGQHHRVAQPLPGRGDRDSPGQGAAKQRCCGPRRTPKTSSV